MNQLIVEAIKQKRVVEFVYDKMSRIVEIHCYGLTIKGNEAFRAYQIDGHSASGELGWKMYDLAKAKEIQILEDSFDVRNDYKKGDKGMREIFCEL